MISPLERGYGNTLGNALRRVLLSSLEGAAITSIRITDVQHEYSEIAGIREDVIQILQKGDIYLHCSVLETFSNALIEAMSVGLPCVSTETGGIPEIVSHRVNGMLSDLDPESVAMTVLELLGNSGLPRILGEAARKSVKENYTWPVLGPGWENILKEITRK